MQLSGIPGLRAHRPAAGDLAFFYDMNVLGNRHIGRNFRLMIINNGGGAEFRLYNHFCVKSGFAESAGFYMAAADHFGQKSHQLIRHYARDLGYEYLSASCKEEYLVNRTRFLTPAITDCPIIFEVFTNHSDESAALKMLRNLSSD